VIISDQSTTFDNSSDVRRRHLWAELFVQALANDRHQAGSIAVVGSIAA